MSEKGHGIETPDLDLYNGIGGVSSLNPVGKITFSTDLCRHLTSMIVSEACKMPFCLRFSSLEISENRTSFSNYRFKLGVTYLDYFSGKSFEFFHRTLGVFHHDDWNQCKKYLNPFIHLWIGRECYEG